MKEYLFYRNVFIAIFLFSSLVCASQNKITVKASVDKNKIILGERFNLTLQITQPDKGNIHFFSFDSIPHFEIVSKEKIDTSTTDQMISLQQTIQLTSFDSGHWYIPSFQFDKRIKTDNIPIDVVFSDFDPKQPYHDIKEIIDVNPPEKRSRWLYAVIASVIVIALIIFLLIRKKKPLIEKAVTIDPYKEVLLQLEKLKGQNIPTRQFYTELVNIFRLYIFRRKGIHSLQKTTDDLIFQLKNLNINKDQFEKLAEALHLSDAVKFAKYTPSNADNLMTFDSIKATVKIIEQIK